MFVNEYYDGYRFVSVLGPGFAWLDDIEGVQARWHILFNFAMIRLISFNMDYYWACNSKKDAIKGHEETVNEPPLSDKDRISTPLKNLDVDYGYLNFLAYILYTPLLLCGPIITFNDFISQVNPNHLYLMWNIDNNSYFSLVPLSFQKHHKALCDHVCNSSCRCHSCHGIDTSLFIRGGY